MVVKYQKNVFGAVKCEKLTGRTNLRERSGWMGGRGEGERKTRHTFITWSYVPRVTDLKMNWYGKTFTTCQQQQELNRQTDVLSHRYRRRCQHKESLCVKKCAKFVIWSRMKVTRENLLWQSPPNHDSKGDTLLVRNFSSHPSTKNPNLVHVQFCGQYCGFLRFSVSVWEMICLRSSEVHFDLILASKSRSRIIWDT